MLDPAIHQRLLEFRSSRKWEQFHTPQNLAVALSVEAAELLEHFQWMSPGDHRPSAAARDAVELEIADLAILLSYLSHDLGIDVSAAVERKLTINAIRYPVEKSRGTATKYDKLT